MWHQAATRLKTLYAKVGVERICKLFGKTRHAYYDRLWYQKTKYDHEQIVLEMLLELKREMPGAGIPTLYELLKQPLLTHGIKMGRDAIQELRRRYKLVERIRRRYAYTTDSNHRFRKYPNIIRELKVIRPGQLWVADITYIRVGNDFNFLSLITDVYSRKVVGYCLYPTLAKEGPLTALRMAIQALDSPPIDLIHHSDRGIQYCCDDYVTELHLYDISISMTENGDPYENAIAERLNGILKKTFGLETVFTNSTLAQEAVSKAIEIYNNKRPHTGIDKLTPEQAHGLTGAINKLWKKRKRVAKKEGNL